MGLIAFCVAFGMHSLPKVGEFSIAIWELTQGELIIAAPEFGSIILTKHSSGSYLGERNASDEERIRVVISEDRSVAFLEAHYDDQWQEALFLNCSLRQEAQ